MSNKINTSAYNFLLCMKFIFQHNIFSIDELLLYLEKSHNIILGKETAVKYLRTFKKLCFEFQRLNNKNYKLINSPLKINFTKNEENTIFKCYNIYKSYLMNDTDYSENIFFDKIKPFLKKSLQGNFNQISPKTITKLNNYCLDNMRLNIIYTDNENFNQKILFEPHKILVIAKTIYLKGYNISQKTTMLLDINKIIKVKQTPVKNKFFINKQYAKLKITSKFAGTYVLKDGEEIISRKDNELIIRSYYYDKNLFFKNILRYMENCEIIAPTSLRNEFKNHIDNLCKIYH